MRQVGVYTAQIRVYVEKQRDEQKPVIILDLFMFYGVNAQVFAATIYKFA